MSYLLNVLEDRINHDKEVLSLKLENPYFHNVVEKLRDLRRQDIFSSEETTADLIIDLCKALDQKVKSNER